MAKRRSAFKRRSKQAQHPQVGSTPKGKWENLSLTAWLLLPIVALVALGFFVPRATWRNSIEQQLAQWRTAYDLSDEVVDRFREIELDFHGSGNPLTTPIKHSPEEVKTHHEQMAALLPPEAGKQFLKDMQSGRWKH